MTSQGIRCPKCGSTSVKQVASHRESPLGVTGDTPDSARATTRYVYQCDCGLAFTLSVKEDSPPNPGAGPI